MKVIVRDFDVLKSLEPQQIATYLQGRNWNSNGNLGNKAHVYHQINDDKSEILLPLKPEFRDFPLLMSQLLETLEKVEGRSQLEILRDSGTSSIMPSCS